MKAKILYLILYLFFLLTPMESISLIQGGHFSITKLSVILLFISFLTSTSVKRNNHNKFMGLFLIYAIWALITAIFSINIEGAILRWISFLAPMIVLLYLLNVLIINEKVISNIMISFIIGCCIPIFIMMNLTFSGVVGEADRMTALEQDQNELSVMLCVAVSFVFILLKRENTRWVKFMLVTFICLSLISILLTGSRTGFIILLVVLMLGLLSLGKKNIFWIAVLGVIIIPLLLPYIPESNIERLLETQEQFSEGDFTGRGYIWENGLTAFNSQGFLRQFLGVGYDQFPFFYNQTYGEFKDPHNTYLATYVEQGLIGCIILIVLLMFTLRKAIVLCRINRSLVYLGMLVPVFVAMMTLGLQTRRWLWIILLMIYIIYKINIKENNPYRIAVK